MNSSFTKTKKHMMFGLSTIYFNSSNKFLFYQIKKKKKKQSETTFYFTFIALTFDP